MRWTTMLAAVVMGMAMAGCDDPAIGKGGPATAKAGATSRAAGGGAVVNGGGGSSTGTTKESVVNQFMTRSEAEWKKELTPEQYKVLREKGTERAFTGEFDKHYVKGTYLWAGCGQEIFTSETKFDSGCGWPAFYAAKAGDRVKLTVDKSHGMTRTEVTCSRCDGHLGHVFNDAPNQPGGQRYCINSVSMKFVPASK